MMECDLPTTRRALSQVRSAWYSSQPNKPFTLGMPVPGFTSAEEFAVLFIGSKAHSKK